ncbi:hypothetical protein SAMN05216223_12988 [Actinacidiphila yanglinensis]|uniref:Alpha/beta hydrolase family protein n=1 Tax=Actinacidiphila yanglinensis TaxID=310779 RepID=A0A1H6E8V3_9ACTN|nr:hypothetical protein [Actinacidiphila yanglinensis]SEG94238.1 hypothetical protein SAMN05216223_12988 [Actinacidiphila yanglinensis]
MTATPQAAPAASRPGPSCCLLAQTVEPLVVHVPEGAAPAPGTPWLIMVHAPGENRTGNNYWQVQAARHLAAAGVTVVRFDLAGYGESLAAKDVGVWERQIAEAAATAHSHGASAVHVAARGLHAALLPGPVPGLRIAVLPPEPEELAWWRLHEEPSGDGERAGGRQPSADWEASPDAPADEVDFWAACGVETHLLGGLTVPVRVIGELVERLRAPDAARGWDLTLCTEGGRAGDPCRMVAGRHGLARLAADRHGLQAVLRSALAIGTPSGAGTEGAR